MPGLDRTGPRGMGAGTGRRAGLCFGGTGAGYGMAGGRRFMGRGRGAGVGPGLGMGFRQRFSGAGPGFPRGYEGDEPPYAQGREEDYLREEAALLQSQLEGIQARLTDLEAKAKTSPSEE